MHLIVGFLNLMIAQVLASLYRLVRLKFIGRAAIRQCCAAFTAGAGIDDGALEVLRAMGPDGLQLLDEEARRRGDGSAADFINSILRR
jgi:hypothetical protein